MNVLQDCALYFSNMDWFHLKRLKEQSNNSRNRRSGEIASRIFVSCKNYVRPDGRHIHNTAADMAMEKIPVSIPIML